ncbi:alpha/beta hydrolase [Gordonia tangerina]|uniref:Alpha/beta hydrolase n=1 Tax=Gordonia tangerina TaxID=2911060 RepID=A0ABS9DCR7_9ACTN|nr:alpha/beta hydrolase [Gordonia tangerina]MCF3937002.1 alpha/beta hydrolase [Gordonia tangerina]
MTETSSASRLANWVTRRTLRPFAEILPGGSLQIRTSRMIVAAGMLIGCPPPHHVRVERLATGTFRGEWVFPPDVKQSRQIILYVHGSGYAVCSARTHRGLVARLTHLTGMPAFTVDYRLAPEHPFPAAADDVEAAYAWLQDIGYQPRNITVAGDSAGGHLILDLLAENVRHGRPQPRSVVMMSPLVDLTLTLAALREREHGPDPLISARAARRLVRHYTRGHPDDLPRLKLALERADDMPRSLIHVGGAEMLGTDARQAQRMLIDAGSDCELREWPGQTHVFQALPALIPEATPALRQIAAFIRQPFGPSADVDVTVAQQKDHATT